MDFEGYDKTVRRLLGFIEEFRKLSPEIQAQQIVVFLHVIGKPGITLKELERLTGLSSSSVSRNVLALSAVYKKGVPGHNLIETFDDPDDRRSKRAKPKARGIAVYNTLVEILRT